MAGPRADLAALLKSAGVPRGARVLRIGRLGAGTEKQLAPILAGFDGPVSAVEGDAFNEPLPADVNLCIVALPVARTADVFEELLYDRVANALAPDGVVVVHFCRDASPAALERMKVAPAARDALRAFTEFNFGAATIADYSAVETRFAEDGVFEPLGWAPRTKLAAEDEPIVWLVLRKRAPAKSAARVIARSPRANRYPLSELPPFLRALGDAGIQFLPVDEFAKLARSTPAVGLVKLDIHREMHRPLEVARALKAANVPALFLMMHRHPFNEAFYDSGETWDILRAIRDEGHEIGLHADVVHLIRAHGDLNAGLTQALTDFQNRGFKVRSATLHGDTSKHIVERGLRARDFFSDDTARSTWDGKPPEGEERIADHAGRYRYADLASKFGIEYLAEAAFRAHGELISPDLFVYLTDNNRSLQLMNVPNGHGTSRMIGSDQPFRLPPGFAKDITPVLRAHPFLALFHPQWFW